MRNAADPYIFPEDLSCEFHILGFSQTLLTSHIVVLADGLSLSGMEQNISSEVTGGDCGHVYLHKTI